MKTHVNPAEALLGVKELESFLVWLADVNPNLAGKIDGDENLTWNLYALFMGITPINRLKIGEHELKSEIAQAFIDYGILTVLAIEIPVCPAKQINYKRIEFVNLSAVRKVVEFNKHLFPEVSDPVEWLINNPSVLCYESLTTTDFAHVCYGVLSGFPPDACLNFVRYKEGMAALEKKGITLPQMLRNPEELRKFFASGKVLKVLDLIPEFKGVLISARLYGFGFYQCFIFSKEDEMYIKALESSFMRALQGIEQLFTS